MFLTWTEISELTGYKYKKLQIKWLLSRGYKFEVSANGSPKILKTYVEQILGGKLKYKAKQSQPDLSDPRLFGWYG